MTRNLSLRERMDAKSIPEPNTGCWLWTGAINGHGYGHIRVTDPLPRVVNAHRIAWELANGSIPPGLVIDHKCRVRACVNPDHLRAISFTENVMCGTGPTAVNKRKALCSRGHPFDDANTRRYGVNRSCRECSRITWRLRHPRRTP